MQTDATPLKLGFDGFLLSQRVCLCRWMLRYHRLLNLRRWPQSFFLGDRLAFSLLARFRGVRFGSRDRSGLVLFLLSLELRRSPVRLNSFRVGNILSQPQFAIGDEAQFLY